MRRKIKTEELLKVLTISDEAAEKVRKVPLGKRSIIEIGEHLVLVIDKSEDDECETEILIKEGETTWH